MLYSFDTMFQLTFSLIAICAFIILALVFIATAKGMAREFRNNQSPRLSVRARVVTKRLEVSSYSHSAGHDLHHHHHYTRCKSSYYVSFEVESGDRIELPVSGEAYAQLAEGDMGKLSFQGTRYLGFERS